MATVKQQIDVHVPVSTAYNQWTQFEELPRFMEGVREVRQLDDAHLHWVAQIGSEVEEWNAEIVEQVPDRIISWRSLDGKPNSGTVRFEALGVDETRVMVEMEYETEGLVQSVGSALGVDERKAKADLERFKELIEGRGVETGAWRGEIHDGHTTNKPGTAGTGGFGGSTSDTRESGGLGGSAFTQGGPSTGLGGGAGAEEDLGMAPPLGGALDEDDDGMRLPGEDPRDEI
jgi:hypothetical protein